MFTKILIATDLSAASMAIVEKARWLTPLGTREILLLQCIEPLEALSVAYSETDAKVKALLDTQKEMLEAYGFKATTEVVYGSIDREVNRIASERGYSLIVIGSKGRTFLHDALLGGVATRMIQNAEHPTLVVRVGAVGQGGEVICILPEECRQLQSHVLFATDFSHNAETAFSYVEKLVGMGTEKVDLVHVQDAVKLERHAPEQVAEFDVIDFSRLKELEKRLRATRADVSVTIEVAHGKPALKILEAASQTNPSLIVMGAQGRGFIDEVVLGSVSYMVTRKARTSVLIVPDRRRAVEGV